MQSQNYWQKGWYRFREAIWPLLEPNEPESMAQEEFIVIDDENLDQALALITKFAESEEDRRKTVESKATLLFSTISVATTFIVASITLLFNVVENLWSAISLVVISFVLCLYTIRTVWFGIKALERSSYHEVAFKDINRQEEKNAYKRHLILSVWEKARLNFRTIDIKVDYVDMAQRYYKRALILIGVYTLFVLCMVLMGPLIDCRF